MGTDAASGWVLTESEDGKPAPPASAVTDIRPDTGGFVSMLVLDMDTYAEKYGNKAVQTEYERDSHAVIPGITFP